MHENPNMFLARNKSTIIVHIFCTFSLRSPIYSSLRISSTMLPEQIFLNDLIGIIYAIKHIIGKQCPHTQKATHNPTSDYE
jgi:hypothetical protein